MKKTGRRIVTFDWAIKTILRDKANFDIKSLYDNGMAIETIAASVGLSEPAICRLLDDE